MKTSFKLSPEYHQMMNSLSHFVTKEDVEYDMNMMILLGQACVEEIREKVLESSSKEKDWWMFRVDAITESLHKQSLLYGESARDKSVIRYQQQLIEEMRGRIAHLEEMEDILINKLLNKENGR